MGVNRVTLLGNLGKDPDLRTTPEKSPVCVLRVATDERHRDREGDPSVHTEWHDVVTFGRMAETCASHLRKGREVYVEGRLRTKKWQDKEGHDRYGTEIHATSVEFVGAKAGTGDTAAVQGVEDAAWQVPTPLGEGLSTSRSDVRDAAPGLPGRWSGASPRGRDHGFLRVREHVRHEGTC